MVKIKPGSGFSITFFVFFALFFLNLASAKNSYSDGQGPGKDAVLYPAYSFFESLKNNNYKKAWSLLTSASKSFIVGRIKDSFVKNRVSTGRAEIRKNMKTGGYIARAYWGGFLKSFNPDMLLKYSTWKIKSVGSGSAEIEIKYRYAKAPAFLKEYRQDGGWKFGLTETFYQRLLMRKIAKNVINKF